MIFDIIFFNYDNKLFFYDIPSGGICPISLLQQKVLMKFDMSSKNIVKALNTEYSTKEILEAINTINSLEKSEAIHRRRLNVITFDHSNMINLQYINYMELTPSVQEAFERLKDRYYSNTPVLKKLETDEAYIEALNEPENAIERIENLIRSLNNPCDFEMTCTEMCEFFDCAKELDNNPSLMLNYIYCEENRSKVTGILALMGRIYRKEKKVLPCPAGIEHLFVDSDGSLYNCQRMAGKGCARSLEELGCFNTVFDITPCCECNVRFLCGGFCSLKRKEYIDACDVIRAVIGAIIKSSIYIGDKDSELVRVIKDLE